MIKEKRKMRQLKFPPYEYIKSLPTVDEDDGGCFTKYDWLLFTTPVDVYGRLSYNEDDSGYIYFDVMENGYCDHNQLGIGLKFNKNNYAKICKHAQKVFDSFYKELDIDYSEQWEQYI